MTQRLSQQTGRMDLGGPIEPIQQLKTSMLTHFKHYVSRQITGSPVVLDIIIIYLPKV